MHCFKTSIVTLLSLLILASCFAQESGNLSPEELKKLIDKRNAVEQELESLAIVDRKVMIPMLDGKRMAADIYRPKDTSRKYPIIFVRTPYNFNYWDVRIGAPRDMSAELSAIKRGYAFVEINERGQFFSEGNYDILGMPLSDGANELTWMGAQPWSNGKVGTIGCSSTAEWQLGVASLGNKALAAIIPEGFGAGVGRVKPYFEQGNWFRGGAFQMLFVTWLYGVQNQVRPMFPPNTSQADLIEASKMFDLAPQMPPVDWSKALTHLPENDIIRFVGGPRGIYTDHMPVRTGGDMIERTPNDPAWYKGGLWHDNMPINVPGLWLMSWYDVSVGPNLAAYNYVRKTADAKIADQQYAVIAPVRHCQYTSATGQTIVGQRDVGDARLDYDALTFGWFDHFLKGENNHILEKTARVQYYTMGSNKWQASDTWPPKGAELMNLYLASEGHASTLHGDGTLLPAVPPVDHPDMFTYDPMNPTPSDGTSDPSFPSGSYDQRKTEENPDVLVFSTPPLKEGIEVTGSIVVTLYVSADVKDTDIAIKLVDVAPGGPAYNVDETIQRLRWRDGYDRPPVWMHPEEVYKVTLSPLNTSNYFAKGHSISIEVSGSNFPRYDRNLNTGGHNYDENTWKVAHTGIHHSQQYPSSVTLSVINH
jgi:putative CocE/NonD family hydrolase